jgi:hypothetical protein
MTSLARDSACKRHRTPGLGLRLPLAATPNSARWQRTRPAWAMLMHSPHAQAGLNDSVEVHTWRFGGRPKN